MLILISTAFSCTGILKSDGDNALFGNNEDWKNPNTVITYVPAEKGLYGWIYFGFDDRWPQGGVNEKGLVYDGFATGPNPVKNSLDKEFFQGNLSEEAMRKCATVEEVEELFSKYNLVWLERAMLMFADANGNSIIIEGDEIVKKNLDYQICTNFYQSELKYGDDIPCNRYKIADKILKDCGVSVDNFRKVLSAVYQEGDWGGTQYSNIYDLKKGLIYLYHFHNFENVVVLDLKKELEKGKRTQKLPELFSGNHAFDFFVMTYNRKSHIALEKNINEKGIESAVLEFRDWKNKREKKYDLEIDEDGLNLLGYKYLMTGKIKEALEIFKINVEEFPDSWNCYDSLAEAYMKSGEKDLAIKNYERSIKMNPNNENGKKMLEELKK
ncbi:MAG: tetratricopeptide repeat protein [Candidatus Delongbacteria bacterium]|nr:tetratricopeptide repeat protein [Candidatus Delongbacteria bacterium]